MEETISNISSQQISHFNKLVDIWWSDNLLKKMNMTRIPALLKFLKSRGFISEEMFESEKPLTGLNILDIGCGAGLLSEPLALLGANITGIDAAKDLIECAKLHAINNKNISNNLIYIFDSIEHFANTNQEKFDVIIASEIVEHVDSIDLFLRSCLKTLKRNGTIFITTINRTMRSWLIAIILYEKIINVIPKGLHEWNKFVTPEELQQVLAKYNCKVVDTNGHQYSYFRHIFSFCDDISVFYYLFAIKQ